MQSKIKTKDWKKRRKRRRKKNRQLIVRKVVIRSGARMPRGRERVIGRGTGETRATIGPESECVTHMNGRFPSKKPWKLWTLQRKVGRNTWGGGAGDWQCWSDCMFLCFRCRNAALLFGAAPPTFCWTAPPHALCVQSQLLWRAETAPENHQNVRNVLPFNAGLRKIRKI